MKENKLDFFLTVLYLLFFSLVLSFFISCQDTKITQSEKELKKWDPVAGEFCWFRSVHGSAEFGIFSGMRDGKYQMRYSKELTGLYNFSYCENVCSTKSISSRLANYNRLI